MSVSKSLHIFFNDLVYNARYKSAEADGNVFPGFRWVFEGKDRIYEDIPTAFHFDLMRGKVDLFFRIEGVLRKTCCSVSDLREEIRNYAISNHIQISDYLKTPNSKGHIPLDELLKSRQNIEKTIAIFEDRTRLHIHDPVRHIYDDKFRADMRQALQEYGEGPPTPGARADQIIHLQQEMSRQETLDDAPLPADEKGPKNKRLIAQVTDSLFNRVLRN